MWMPPVESCTHAAASEPSLLSAKRSMLVHRFTLSQSDERKALQEGEAPPVPLRSGLVALLKP